MNLTPQDTHTMSRLDEHAEELFQVAQAFRGAAGEPGSTASALAALGPLVETLQVLSASWCEVAADAAPSIVARRNLHASEDPPPSADCELSHEQEAHLMATLHDVAGAFARCARTCRHGRSTIAPLLAGHSSDERGGLDRHPELV